MEPSRTILRHRGLAVHSVRLSERYGGSVTSSLDEVAHQAIKFLTVTPRSTERVPLDVKLESSQLTVDEASEQEMFALVNAERQKAGIDALRWDNGIVK